MVMVIRITFLCVNPLTRKMHLSEPMLSEKTFVPTKVGIEMDSERIPRGLATGLASE